MQPRETFDDVVVRLLEVYLTIKGVSDTLGPNHYLKREKTRQEVL
jgi:hypothetical protein